MKLKILLVLAVLVLAIRIPLLNPGGRYFFGDEIFYKRLIITSQQSEKTNNPLLFWQGVFGIYAKPGYGILYSVPIWLEGKTNIPYGAMLNVLINSLLIVFMYLILRKFLDSRTTLLATVIVTLSIASVFYIRHMLPYDIALLVLLLGLYVFLRTKSYFLFGLITASSFTIYPSYFYYLIPIPFIIFVFERFKLVKPIVFCAGFLAVLISMQMFSLIIGASPSYFAEAQHLSGIVTQGDFIPAMNFLIEYIHAYDGDFGLAIALLSPFLFFIRRQKVLIILAIYLLVVFLVFEVFSHLIPKTVLYGRTVRPYYFLLLISGVIVFDNLLKNISKKFNGKYYFLYGLFILAMFINWWSNFSVFKNLVYPADVRQEAEKYLSVKPGRYILEDVYTKKETVDDMTTDPPVLEAGKFYLVNPTLLYPYYGNLDIPCRKEVLFEREHPLSFKPYRYEGFTREMRQYLEKDLPKYQLVYCK